jgi:hypothetical protein
MHRRLSAQYGDSVLPQRSVYEWIDKFKNGRTSVTHEEGAGRLSTAATDDNIERVRDVILLDRRRWKKYTEEHKCWKIMLLQVFYFYWNKVCTSIADNYWPTYVITFELQTYAHRNDIGHISIGNNTQQTNENCDYVTTSKP